ncbi:PSME3-interacting protein-like [Homarus americanus]|uniref:PSME3-interacting protein-like n=1 Tax=Homarus americanus TaxID=6706 RepID=A0A8J5K7C2_HOMAM|nr:PSME3-interacting protein-like [Homarus americanus]XP_042223230.1 PSME3-interacting protein-like [Homarus americanus]XP_042223231.1 PSME3-interacting protein-like [Homarus americanus]KAG7168265.1 PSME3-interacting protein-like [Homarus americanus]
MSSGFISEKEVAERRRVRQEDWDKNRGDEDPEEAPEEPPQDPRSLYDRLQEQRQKKQDEYDEAHKFKNMVRGLEDDEVDFLELVDRSKLQEEKRVRTEENSAMVEYRKKVSAMQKNIAEEEMRAELKASEMRKNTGGAKKSSHLSLLAGAIKRKNSDDDKNTEEASDSKKAKPDSPAKENPTTVHPASGKSGFQCIAVLPGLGVYTDSSDSDNNIDSDSDEDDEIHSQIPQQSRDITGRIVKSAAQCSGQSGC